MLRPGRGVSARAGEPRLVARRGGELVDRAPERRERAAAARVVPHARRDDAAGPGHARHLAQAQDGVGQEVHDELGQGGVDRVVTEVSDIGAKLVALATWDDVLPEAEARGALPAEALAELRAWLADPFAWSAARGGLAAPDPAWKA